MKFFILLSMLFCHIVDDYYLQGILSSLKQREWWEKYDRMYNKDYLIALFMHGFSWSFVVHAPITIYFLITKAEPYLIVGISCICHALVHAIVDHLKANVKIINLTQDQLIHIIQIVIIFITILIL